MLTGRRRTGRRRIGRRSRWAPSGTVAGAELGGLVILALGFAALIYLLVLNAPAPAEPGPTTVDGVVTGARLAIG